MERPTAIVSENSYGFRKPNCTVTYKFPRRQPREKDKFFLLCALGHGSSGKAFLATTQRGNAFVFKMYFVNSEGMVNFSVKERANKVKEQQAKNKKVAVAECCLWKELYPDLDYYTHVRQLNEIWCLSMPYAASVPLEKRPETLLLVEKELTRFAEQGFTYASKDVRWRHVGRIKVEGESKILLLDLGSLVKRNLFTKEQVKKEVEATVSQLGRRAGTDKVAPPAPIY